MDANLKRKKSRRKYRFSRLSAKIAFSAFIASIIVSVISDLLSPGFPAWAHVFIPVWVGVSTYFIAFRLLSDRIMLARTTLKQVRKHQFENLENAHLPKGDELNALIWQVYRAGLAMEKEMQELRKVENYRREFLGNVSHELKTPIFTIQGFTETLLDGALKDDSVNEKFLLKILSNSKRLKNLSNDLVEISRIETGELEMVIAPFQLTDVIGEVIDELEEMALDKSVKLFREIQDNLPLILGDRARISQVLINLVDNAVKYSNNSGAVEIVARQLPDGAVKVSVVDNGIGIAPQHIPRLTERFYRVDKSRSRIQGGTGLGLAIVKHILGAHETEMLLESKPGLGSTFGFTLPSVLSNSQGEKIA